MNNAVPFIAERYHQQVMVTPLVARMYYPCILRVVQVNVHDYLHSVSTNVADNHDGINLPEFRSLLWDLRHGTFRNAGNWVPLPEGYLATPPRPTTLSGGDRRQHGYLREHRRFFNHCRNAHSSHQSGQPRAGRGLHRHCSTPWRHPTDSPGPPTSAQRRRERVLHCMVDTGMLLRELSPQQRACPVRKCD